MRKIFLMAACLFSGIALSAQVTITPPQRYQAKTVEKHSLNVKSKDAPKIVDAVPLSDMSGNFFNAASKPNLLKQDNFKQNSISLNTLNESEDFEIYATKIYDASWALTGNEYGLYRINPQTGEQVKVLEGQPLFGREMAYEADGYYYVLIQSAYDWIQVYYENDIRDMDNYIAPGQIVITPVINVSVSTANDLGTQDAYGCFQNLEKDGYIWGKFSPETRNVEEIAVIETPIMALGQDYSGQYYGIDDQGNFGTVNKYNGSLTVIKNNPQLACSTKTAGALDRATGTFYYIVFKPATEGYTSDLYSIDINTGEATFLTNLPGGCEYSGMFIPRPVQPSNAPAAASNITLNFEENNNFGVVEFDLPTTLNDGTPTADDLSWRLLFNGIEVASGIDPAGQHIQQYVDVDDEDKGLTPNTYYTVAVIVSNSNGSGPESAVSQFIGSDSISTISNVKLEIVDNEFVLTWDPPKAAHGGFIDFENGVSYDIYLYTSPSDSKLVASNYVTSDHKWSMSVGDYGNGSYYFGIIPWIVSPGETATRDEVFSNTAIIGHFQLPFAGEFTSDSDVPYTILDANQDGETWYLTGTRAEISYNPSLAMDDWIFAGPVEIPSGTPLTFKLSAGCNGYDETIEVFLGTSPNPEAMTVQLLEPQTFDSSSVEFSSSLYQTQGGEFFLGFHGCSAPDQYIMYLYDFELKSAGSAKAPGNVTDVEAVRSREGTTLFADLTFKAPATNMEGDPISELDNLQVLLNGEEIETFTTVSPGQQLSISHIEITKPGDQSFQFVASNEEGTGSMYVYNKFIGWAAPKTPEWMTATPGEKDNTIFIEWEDVTVDVNGDDIPMMWYNPMIYYADTHQRAFVITSSTSYLHDPVLIDSGGINDHPEEQQFVMYYVSGYYYDTPGFWTDGGHAYQSGHVYSNWCPVGPAYTLPYKDSFSNQLASTIMLQSQYETNGLWSLTDKSTNPSASPVDGDEGLLIFNAQRVGDKASLHSGLIDLREAIKPVMSFYYFGINGSQDKLTMEIDVMDEFTPVLDLTLGQENVEGWTKVEIDLSDFNGHKIRYRLTGECVNGSSNILVDDIEINEMVQNNLGIAYFNVPAKVKVGDDAVVATSVTNNGKNVMDAYQLILKANDKEISSVLGKSLAVGESEEFEFTVPTDVTYGTSVTFTLTLIINNDDYEKDNSTSATTIIEIPAYPVPTELTAVAGGSDKEVELYWNEPNLSYIPGVLTTEDVETMTPFSLEPGALGDWTCYDGDKNPTSFRDTRGYEFPELPSSVTASWIVIDGSQLNGYEGDYDAHSGKQVFMTTYSTYGNEGNDDWLISPKLSGVEQSVSFFVRAIINDYGKESYEVLYSTTDTDPESFIKVGETRSVDATWTQDIIDLPEGAKYFAIRYISYDVYGLLVDDVTFEKYGVDDDNLNIVGYNVYRNLENIDQVAYPYTYYTDYYDGNAQEENITYNVSAVYELGESALSDPAVYTMASSLGMYSDSKVIFGVEENTIIIKNAENEDIKVYSTDGKLLHSTIGNLVTRIPVNKGVYVVSVGKDVAKLIVR